MARAVAKCNCEKCGKNFERMKYNLRNRAEANNWEEWAQSTFTLCTECWKKEQEEKMINDDNNEIIEMHYSDYKNKYSWCKTVSDSYDKDKKTIKVIVDKIEEYKRYKEKFDNTIKLYIKEEIKNGNDLDSICNTLYNNIFDSKLNEDDKVEYETKLSEVYFSVKEG